MMPLLLQSAPRLLARVRSHLVARARKCAAIPSPSRFVWVAAWGAVSPSAASLRGITRFRAQGFLGGGGDKPGVSGGVALVLAISACGGAGEETLPPEPTPPWEPPTFSGDGLPESEDTQHSTGESGSSGETPAPDEGEEVQPDLIIADGVFSYVVGEKGTTGVLVLMSVSLNCRDMFGSQSDANPDGLYFTNLIPSNPREPTWLGTYTSCGTPPCYRDAYALVAGEYSPLTEEDWISITSYDAHYVTASWFSAQTEGEISFYNCGDFSVWQ